MQPKHWAEHGRDAALTPLLFPAAISCCTPGVCLQLVVQITLTPHFPGRAGGLLPLAALGICAPSPHVQIPGCAAEAPGDISCLEELGVPLATRCPVHTQMCKSQGKQKSMQLTSEEEEGKGRRRWRLFLACSPLDAAQSKTQQLLHVCNSLIVMVWTFAAVEQPNSQIPVFSA